MKSRFIICSIFMMLLCACSTSSDREQLLYIESIIDERADSALVLLNEIPYDRLRSEEDRALYGMLQAQANDKNWIVLEDDSLAFAAARYFEEKGDKHRCLIATYYGGRIQYSNGRYSEALISFLQSKELAEELGEVFWAGMSCRGISDTYHKSFNIADELVYAQEEYRYTLASGRQPYINYAMLDLASAYNNNGNYEKSREITFQIVDSAMKYQDGYLYCEAKRLEGISYMGEREAKKAEPIFEMICQAGMGITQDSIYLSRAYIVNGNLSKSEELLNLISNEDSLLLSDVRYRLLKMQGKTSEAIDEVEYLYDLINRRFKERINQTLNSTVIGFYDLEKEKKDAELSAAKMRMWLLVVISLVIILSIILVTWYFIAQQRKQIEEKVLFAEQLQELVAKGDAEKSHSVSMMKDLFASKYNLLEEFCDIVTSNWGSKTANQKIANAVTALVDSLSINSERIEELERDVDGLYDNLMTDFKRDLPHLKDADYCLYLYTVLGLSNMAISLFLKEDKVSAVYDRKKRLKNKIKMLAPEGGERYMRFL